LFQGTQALVELADFATGLGQQGQEPWPRHSRACGPPASKPLADLGDTLRHLALLREGPAPWEQAPGPIRADSLLRTQRQRRLRLRPGRLGLAAQLMEVGG